MLKYFFVSIDVHINNFTKGDNKGSPLQPHGKNFSILNTGTNLTFFNEAGKCRVTFFCSAKKSNPTYLAFNVGWAMSFYCPPSSLEK